MKSKRRLLIEQIKQSPETLQVIYSRKPCTLVEVHYTHCFTGGQRAYTDCGFTRCSATEAWNPEAGVQRAYGRAMRAIARRVLRDERGKQ